MINEKYCDDRQGHASEAVVRPLIVGSIAKTQNGNFDIKTVFKMSRRLPGEERITF